MKSPSLHTIKSIQEWDVQIGDTRDYYPARSLGYPSFPSRVKLAWGVFTGKYDALKWPGDQ